MAQVGISVADHLQMSSAADEICHARRKHVCVQKTHELSTCLRVLNRMARAFNQHAESLSTSVRNGYRSPPDSAREATLFEPRRIFAIRTRYAGQWAGLRSAHTAFQSDNLDRELEGAEVLLGHSIRRRHCA
jgi:hypothetical protein